MPFYCKQGNIPKKRHTIFEDSKGGKCYEELISREGFSSIYTNLYHLNMPTSIERIGKMNKLEIIKGDAVKTIEQYVTNNPAHTIEMLFLDFYIF